MIFGSNFITYIKSGGVLKTYVSPGNNGYTWVEHSITGLPATVDFNSITAINESENTMLYAQIADKSIYKSSDGFTWSKTALGMQVETIYGKIPTVRGEFKLLAVVKEEGVFKYATTSNLSTFSVLNKVTNDNIPLKDYSAISFEDPEVFSTKYIIAAGGTNAAGTKINRVFLFQEKGNEIKVHDSKDLSFNAQNGKLFAYDSNLYLLTSTSAGNKFHISENYSVTWKTAETNQALPQGFTTRTEASVVTDENNYIWIFGGKSGNNTQIADVWRGRLNKFTP